MHVNTECAEQPLDDGGDEGSDQEEEAAVDMETLWPYIVGMLTNLGALPFPRYIARLS